MTQKPGPTRAPWTRDVYGDDALEMLLVFAVVTILGIRGFLALTGYPHLGGAGLHIAHMLWGGLFMLVAIFLLLVFWNPFARRIAAIVAGVGFGFFIDELGKFITLDNDYFFKPTIAVLYVLFLVLFAIVRYLRTARPPSEEVVSIDKQIRALLEPHPSEPGSLAQFFFATRKALLTRYRRITHSKGYGWAIKAWFLLLALANLLVAITVLATGRRIWSDVSLLQTVAAVLQALCVWIGSLTLRRSRLNAYTWFQRSVLVSLLVIQVGNFYTRQFWALIGLAFNVVVYLGLGAMIDSEKSIRAQRKSRSEEAFSGKI